MARNWEDYGIRWHTTTVRRERGTVTRAGAEIPEIVNVDAFAAALSRDGSNLMNVVNASNSPTVRAQSVARNSDVVGETLREAVWRAIVGMRSEIRTVTQTKVIMPLPNGTTYDGNDRTEFVAAFMAAALDAMGMAPDQARQLAENMANGRQW